MPDVPGDITSTIGLDYYDSVNAAHSGLFEVGQDDDFIRVTLNAGSSHLMFLSAETAGGGINDALLTIYDSAGNIVAVDNDSGVGNNAYMVFTPAVSGTYFLSFSSASQQAGSYDFAMRQQSVIPEFFTDGDDVINYFTGYIGSHWVGGRGNDAFIQTPYQNDIYAVFGEQGNDSFSVDEHVSTNSAFRVWGGGGDDYIVGGISGDYLFGGSGNDTISGGGALDRIMGGAGNDIIDGGEGNDVIDGGEGNDLVAGSGGNDSLNGAVGDDYLDGGAGTDTLLGGAGSDILACGLEADVLDGGLERDTADYTLSGGGVTIDLTLGTASGGHAQGDVLISIENLTGSAFADELTGNAYNNELSGGGGADTMTGHAGNDVYYVDNVGDVVVEGAGQGTADRMLTSISYTLGASAQIEILSTTNAAGIDAINLTGNGLAQQIGGNAGNNIIDGRAGADSMTGFAGNDRYFVDNAGDVIVEGAAQGTADRVMTSITYTLGAAAQIELFTTTNTAGTGTIHLTGNGFAQQIAGNAGINVLNGGGGADTMTGFAGNDQYYVDNAGDVVVEGAGQGTADRVLASVSYTLGASAQVELLTTTNAAGTGAINLTGNGFAQSIGGNAGINVLNGGLGNDTLTGFGGLDTFFFNTALGAGNIDRIVDYNVAQDTIRLENAIFAGLANGALAAGAFNTGAAAAQADDRIIYNAATGALIFDADGVGGNAGIRFATLNAGLGLTSADFAVI